MFSQIGSAQISSLISIDSNGKLTYTPDENGNVIPDFSMVGYHQGEQSIPEVPVKITLYPSDTQEDRYEDIQNAIDSLASLGLDANKHRGAILLTAGYYPVERTLNINSSGIVIRGEGKGLEGTIIEYTAKEQSNLFEIRGSGNADLDNSTISKVIDDYVPIGTKTITVEPGHTFEVGDRVYYSHKSNDDWIELLGMHNLEEICGDGHSNWPAGTLRYKRKVTKVNSNEITLDAPIVEPVEEGYHTAELSKYKWNDKIEECGVENIRLLSSFEADDDEEHGWVAIEFRNIENAWVKDVNAYYFGYGCVSVGRGSYQVSVLNSGMYDYKSRIAGGRRYGFNSDDCDLALFKNCESKSGRHSFVQGSRTPGPNVYTNCIATNSYSDEGPHHRWSTGTLWDQIKTDNDINVQNRLCSGSGHGWAGTQQVLWNCTANKMVLQDPPLNSTNWAIGCTAEITNESRYEGVEEEIGIVESINSPIADIPSLYEAQLEFRLAQLNSNIENDEKISAKAYAYPNPTNGVINIKTDEPLINRDIKVYDIFGKQIIDFNINRKSIFNITLDLSNLNNGIYFIDSGFEVIKVYKK